ncbi:Dipeptidyl-peptidase 7 [Candidatus Sulfotelmatobacter kueseliae]|uniref:Dipeptidyl-peptidase n=1 Tax=Candidatus Sulfotelmatobacter kueseliae TaxID=2042962 RepID=A0A2U3KSA2_9BACT|nr:Dipeptidyl-peptidase 7 [Candidatus Sulfotelmatobacter kueseliae]
MKRHFAVLLALVFVFSTMAPADEGMWLYNAPPKDRIKAKYGFEVTQEWLDHVRLSSVRFNNGGSGSFVSADGLTFTNHHVGAGCVQQLSTEGRDYIKTGFYARTQAEEAKCPNLELNELVGIEDVTDKINAGVKPEMSAAEAGQAQRAAMSQVEKDCATATGLRCDVVTFYSGQVYNLYKYKKYTDVRLVFAPEFDIAFFGGDPDNFTYPRYDLDITFFRVYEDGKPAHLDHYLQWSRTGVKDGDLIFVSGHPGSTGRLLTMAQIEFLRDVQYPMVLKLFERRVALLQDFSKQSEENARIAKEDIFGLQNSQKAITGYQSGLLDKAIMEAKAADEAKLHAAFKADPKNGGAADPWEAIAQAIKVQRSIYPDLTFLERLRGFNSRLAQTARVLVRAAAEKPKPNAERMREFRDSGLPSLEQQLFSTEPIYKNLEAVQLSDSLSEMQDSLGKDNPDVQKALQGKAPADAAKDMIGNTKLDDVAVRKQLYEGGQAAIDASTDPLIVAMRAIDPSARAARKQFEDKVESVVRVNGTLIAKARFTQSGFTQPPDATFTLRLSYGAVKGYPENGKAIPFATNMGGAYEHAAEHNNQAPYNLPDSWMKSKAKLDLKTPLNFVSTADIIGGNSGSPTVNKKGEVVGIIFDGNIESLPWNFAYSDGQGRAVSVDSRGIQEALRKIYGATALADELLGTKAEAATTGK